MVGRPRRVLIALVAMLLLASTTQMALARSLSLSSSTFRVTWTPLQFSETEEITRCNITLEGSFHSSTFAKTSGALIGYITSATVGSCPAGSARFSQETLPWHVRYGAFTGTLPNVTGVALDFVGFFHLIVGPGGFQRCEYVFTAEEPGRIIANVGAGGAITSARMDETRGHTLINERLTFVRCPRTLRPRGTGAMTVLNSTTSITVRLI